MARRRAREARVERLEVRLQLPMALLGFVWLAALVVQLVTSAPRWVENLTFGIWGVFLVEFVVRFAVAIDKRAFLRANWISAIAIALPVVPGVRALRAVQSLRAARVVAALGTIKADLASVMRQHGVKYVVLFTVVVTFAGAAAMYAVERGTREAGFRSYGDALWWTAMMVTTIGSQYWPHTGLGRILALVLSAYALSVFGYVTAALSAFLIGRDAAGTRSEPASARSLDALQREVATLARQVERLAETPGVPAPRAREREPRDAGERG
jgi:voltage-gated potassium channel